MFNRALVMTALVGSLTACTIAPPLKLSRDGASLERQPVYVAISDAVYRKDIAARMRFWRQTFDVIHTLEDQPGFLGFAARIELFGNRATTMTAWKDRASMREFAYGDGLHKRVADNDTTLIDAAFYGAEFDPETLPSWEEALELLDVEGRHYFE